jgi:hypothetical protein
MIKETLQLLRINQDQVASRKTEDNEADVLQQVTVLSQFI